jgi:hypothetical protein
MKRTRILLLLLGLSLIAAGVFYFLLPREPIYQGRPISEWIEELTGNKGGFSGAVASQALPKLLQAEPGPEVVPYLRATLHRGNGFMEKFYINLYPRLVPILGRRIPAPNPLRDTELRYRAAVILYYMGPRAQNSARDLVQALSDSDVDVRRMAATALGTVSNGAEFVKTGLKTALGDPSSAVRRAALRAIANSGPKRSDNVPVVAGMLKDPDEGVRVDAAQILKDFGPDARAAVTSLTAALQDTNGDVFRFAAMALGKIGPDAHESIDALRLALKNPRPYTETTIRWALKRIETEEKN